MIYCIWIYYQKIGLSIYLEVTPVVLFNAATAIILVLFYGIEYHYL